MIHKARAFALVEVLVVVCLATVLLAVCLPMIREQRRQASIRGDVSRLRLIGQASAMYADDFADRLFTFSWRQGEVPVTPNTELAAACAALPGNSGNDDVLAAKLQQLDLVTRLSDFRLIQPTLDQVPVGHLPHLIHSHLVLAYYMGETMPSEAFISYGDAARNDWVESTVDYLQDPVGATYRPPTSSTDFRDLWRWPFSSSFMLGPSHFATDSAPPQTVRRISNHRSWQIPQEPGLIGRRTMTEVAHPSAKVMMFDEYDRYTGSSGQYFGLENSRPIVSFYDGHAQRVLTYNANLGFNPNQPKSSALATYAYIPIKWWDPFGSQRTLTVAFFDQTRDGLQGVDYPQYENRRPVVGQ